MENFIILGILLIIVGTASYYIYKEKKKGSRCIGCSSSGCCSAKKSENKTEPCKCHSSK